MKNLFLTGVLCLVVLQQTASAQTGQKYTSIQEGMQQPDSVVWFSMRAAGLMQVPDELRYFRNLRYLDLSYNSIEVIPDFLASFSQLVYADFSHNSIIRLPERLPELTALRNLYISFQDAQQLETSAAQMAQLSNLRVLHVAAPDLTCWPEAFNALHQVECLSLTGTRLRELPANIQGLRNLQYLSIGNSHEFNLTSAIAVLSKLSRLRELHLSDQHNQQAVYYTSANRSMPDKDSATDRSWHDGWPLRTTIIYMDPELFTAPSGNSSSAIEF